MVSRLICLRLVGSAAHTAHMQPHNQALAIVVHRTPSWTSNMRCTTGRLAYYTTIDAGIHSFLDRVCQACEAANTAFLVLTHVVEVAAKLIGLETSIAGIAVA